MPKLGAVNEPILSFVRRRLQECRGEWPRIAEKTGVPYFTITNLVQEKVANPRIATVQPLFDYFVARDAERAA